MALFYKNYQIPRSFWIKLPKTFLNYNFCSLKMTKDVILVNLYCVSDKICYCSSQSNKLTILIPSSVVPM